MNQSNIIIIFWKSCPVTDNTYKISTKLSSSKFQYCQRCKQFFKWLNEIWALSLQLLETD